MSESDGEVPGETALTWIREEKVGKRKKNRERGKRKQLQIRERETENKDGRERECQKENVRETQEEDRKCINGICSKVQRDPALHDTVTLPASHQN